MKARASVISALLGTACAVLSGYAAAQQSGSGAPVTPEGRWKGIIDALVLDVRACDPGAFCAREVRDDKCGDVVLKLRPSATREGMYEVFENTVFHSILHPRAYLESRDDRRRLAIYGPLGSPMSRALMKTITFEAAGPSQCVPPASS